RLDATPTLFVDPTWNPAELDAVLDGLESWKKAIPEFRPHVVMTSDRAQMIGNALGHEVPDAIYLVRIEGVNDPACPDDDRRIPEDAAGYAERHGDQGVTCIDAAQMSSWQCLLNVTEHELGHLFGLPHKPPPSIMQTVGATLDDARSI